MSLREAHAHIGPLGEALALPSLEGCADLGEALARIARAASSCASWLLVKGARVESWAEQRWPRLAELDQATRGVPTMVMSFDHHMAMANSAALAANGLREGDVIPPNGRVDAGGILHESAMHAAWRAAPQPTPADRAAQVREGLAHLASLGFDEVHDLHSQPWLPQALDTVTRSGGNPMRHVWLYPPVAELLSFARTCASLHTPCVKLAGGKLFADGTINARTALMLDPYADPIPDAPRGRAMHTHEEIDAAVAACDAMGLHLAVHAIGDGAVRMVLDSIERVKPITPGTRIEHAELIHPADVPRFASLGVTASVQPCHLLADIEALRRLLPHAHDRVLPIKSLIASGLRPGAMVRGIVFGSDAPIVGADPGDSIQAAVHRRRASMPAEHAIGTNEAIDEPTAWRCFAGARSR